MQDGEAGKTGRKREGQGVESEESLALCLLQAKNNTQPGLQQARGVCVCLSSQTQQLDA